MALHLTEIDGLVQQIRNSFARQYMEESLVSFRAGAYRSSIISSWVAVCVDIIEKIRELSIHGDKKAEELEKQLDAINPDDFKALQTFERKLLNIACDDFEFISPIEKGHLERLREDRNICAHPSFQKDVSHFKPSAELARLHLVQSCQTLLIHPPTKGKAIVDTVYALITEESFPKEDELAFKLLSSENYLGRAKESVARNALIILLKRLFRDEEKISISLFHRITSAINALHRINPGVCQRVMQEKLSSLLSDCSDIRLRRVLPFLSRCTDSWGYIEDAISLRIQGLVLTLKAQEIVNLEVPHLATLIPTVKGPLLERVESLNHEDKKLILASSPSPYFRELAIETFVNSGSFASAYDNGEKYLIPHAEHFDKGDLDKVLTGAISNNSWGGINQILNAGGIDEIFANLYAKTKAHLPAAEDSWRKFWLEVKNQGYTYETLQTALTADGVIEPETASNAIELKVANDEIPF